MLTLTRLAGMLIDTDKCYWNVLYKGKVSIEDGAQVLSLLALLVQQYKYCKCYWNVLYKGKVSIEDGAQVLSLLALLVQQYKY
jgi:hypothetical protein